MMWILFLSCIMTSQLMIRTNLICPSLHTTSFISSSLLSTQKMILKWLSEHKENVWRLSTPWTHIPKRKYGLGGELPRSLGSEGKFWRSLIWIASYIAMMYIGTSRLISPSRMSTFLWSIQMTSWQIDYKSFKNIRRMWHLKNSFWRFEKYLSIWYI